MVLPDTTKAKRIPLYILTLLLWLASAVLGLLAVFFLRELTLLIYATVGDDFYVGVMLSQVVTIVAGLVWIVAIVGTGEYHIKHPAQRKSWIIFAWTIGIEVLIIALALLLRL